MRRVLTTAFHVPPLAGNNGIRRTLRCARFTPPPAADTLPTPAAVAGASRRGPTQQLATLPGRATGTA